MKGCRDDGGVIAVAGKEPRRKEKGSQRQPECQECGLSKELIVTQVSGDIWERKGKGTKSSIKGKIPEALTVQLLRQ